MAQYISYDEGVDHLTLHKSDEKIDSNIDTGLAILSLNKKREIVGIEFMGAHKNFKLPLDALKNIKSCNIEMKYFPSQKLLIINAMIRYKEKESPLTWSHSDLDLGSKPFKENIACSTA